MQDGLIHKDEFVYGLFKTRDGRSNILVDKIFQRFDVKRNDVIDFEEFVHSLSIFHPGAALEEKAACELSPFWSVLPVQMGISPIEMQMSPA